MIPIQTFESYPVFGNNATKVQPDNSKYSNGFLEGDVYPAEYVNWAWAKSSKGVTDLNAGLSSVEKELNTILTCAGLTPSSCDDCVDQVYKSIMCRIEACVGTSAPKAHASSETTYGVGNADCYGHLKISDTYTSVLSACTGVAASQKAVACVYSVANGKAAVGSTVGCALGTAAAGTATTAARSDHVHPLPSCVLDSTNASCKITFNYGAAGVTNPVWIAGWNGYELRAVCRATLCVAYATCTTNAYHDTYTGNADRPIMVTSDNDYSAAGYYAQGTVRSGCNFTYNPATGMLKLKSNGKTACISHQNASYLHIYTDAACIAFNQDVYLPSGKYIDRAKYACCASYNGSGTAFGTAAACAATAFRSCTWYPDSLSCGCVCCAANAANSACTSIHQSCYYSPNKNCFTLNGVCFLFFTGCCGAYSACNTNKYAAKILTWYHCVGSTCVTGSCLMKPLDYVALGGCWCCCQQSGDLKNVSVADFAGVSATI